MWSPVAFSYETRPFRPTKWEIDRDEIQNFVLEAYREHFENVREVAAHIFKTGPPFQQYIYSLPIDQRRCAVQDLRESMEHQTSTEEPGAIVVSWGTVSATNHQAPSSLKKRRVSRQLYAGMFGLCFLVSMTCTFRLNFRALRPRLFYQDDESLVVARRELVEVKKVGLRAAAPLSPRPRSVKRVSKNQSPRLDFFIAGFPKCGTTTLLYAFGAHKETSISNKEKCSIRGPGLSDNAATVKLDEALKDLDQSHSVKRGIKCPSGLQSPRALEVVANHSPDARIVIGVRHPVLYFQSYYNYRITEIHNKKLKDPIPPIESLVGGFEHEWKGVSTDNARFELFLMQLGKTNLTTSNMDDLMGRPNMGVKPNPFSVFIYSLEQLEDDNEERSSRFRSDMQNFLGLEEPIPPFGHENLNHFVGDKALDKTIDICDPKYTELRTLLVRQGAATQKWIRTQFLASPDVFVGGDKQHFLSLLSTWGKDPCKPKNFLSAMYS